MVSEFKSLTIGSSKSLWCLKLRFFVEFEVSIIKLSITSEIMIGFISLKIGMMSENNVTEITSTS